MRELFSFPNPVNEKAARVVAGVVLVTVILILATSWYWLLIPLAYGFWARVLTGPTLSPLGWTAQNVIAPRLGPKKPVPGPPNRCAPAMGAVGTAQHITVDLRRVVGLEVLGDGGQRGRGAGDRDRVLDRPPPFLGHAVGDDRAHVLRQLVEFARSRRIGVQVALALADDP